MTESWLWRWILVIVLFALMVSATGAWYQSKHNAGIGEGNQTLLCDTLKLQLATTTAKPDRAIITDYQEICNASAP